MVEESGCPAREGEGSSRTRGLGGYCSARRDRLHTRTRTSRRLFVSRAKVETVLVEGLRGTSGASLGSSMRIESYDRPVN